MECLQAIAVSKDNLIDDNLQEIKEYQSIIAIPRKHFKHIEGLELEQLKNQREGILRKIQAAYNVPL